MSPDDIFAAQMWSWPDPVLKRDAMGRVLFVNAAFLQIYGGAIENWRGNALSGWPAPQPAGTPYRFETRIASDMGEQLYDWMEFTLTDGQALAVARNVTHYAAAVTATPAAQAQITNTDVSNQGEAASTPNNFDNYFNDTNALAEQAADQGQPPAAGDGVFGDTAAAPLMNELPASDPISDRPAMDAMVNTAPSIDANAAETVNIAMQAPAPDAPMTSADTLMPDMPADQNTPQDNDRAYERRALPLENDDAVLGNNWRDAVIAKAVGIENIEDTDNDDTSDPESADDGNPAPIRILLAEDNAINALLTRTLLEAEGHTVDTVEDGVLAVETMKSTSYDLIFMDMRMPNMDGLEATRKIRALNNVPKELPIIALTANAFDDDRNACFDSGMNDFMTKPVSAEELSEMVKTWAKKNG